MQNGSGCKKKDVIGENSIKDKQTFQFEKRKGKIKYLLTFKIT